MGDEVVLSLFTRKGITRNQVVMAASAKEQEWVLEGIVQFVRSPLWNAPINNFIDNNCFVFDGEEESKLEYTEIHKQFQDLVEQLLSTYLEELGVEIGVLVALCKTHMETNEYARKFLDYILILDDFISFKKMMEKRNVELEYEALKVLKGLELAGKTGHEASAQPTSEHEGWDDDERILQLALAASMADAEVNAKEAEVEDAELQRALALSLAIEEERLREQKQKFEEEARHNTQPQQHTTQLLQAEEEHAHRVQELHDVCLQSRREVAQKVVEKHTQACPDVEPLPQKDSSPSEPGIIRVTKPAEAQAQPNKQLPDVGGRRGGFGFKPLPAPALSKTFAELKSECRQQSPKSEPQTLPAPKPKNDPTSEELEERRKHLQEQRDRIVALHKKERDRELQSFAQVQSVPAPPASHGQTTAAQNGVDQLHQQLSRDLARRFREDIVEEVRKAKNNDKE